MTTGLAIIILTLGRPFKNMQLSQSKILRKSLFKIAYFHTRCFFLFRSPFKKLNSSLIFHRISPQNDLNENLFILLWENLRICNCLKAKFWENRYSKLLIFIQVVFFCFGHPLKNWIARSFFIGFRPKMTWMKLYLYYFEKI